MGQVVSISLKVRHWQRWHPQHCQIFVGLRGWSTCVSHGLFKVRLRLCTKPNKNTARPWALLSGCRIFANSAAASSRFLSSLPQTSEIPKNPFIPLSGTPFLLRSILRFCSWPHKGMKDGCLKIHESSRGPNLGFPICYASVDLRYNHLSSMGFFRGPSAHAIFPLLDSNNRFLPWPLAIVFVFFSTIWAKKTENFRYFPHKLHSLKLQTRSSTGSNHTWALSSCLIHESILHEWY